MKNIIKVLLVVMALVLAMAAFTACEPQQPEQTQPVNPTPGVCTHENIEFVLGTEPTCTEDGLTSGFKCKDCGEWTVAQEVDPAGHDYTVKVEVDATCTEAGYTEMKCARCDATTDHKVIEPYGHELVDMKGKAATCTEDGYSDYKACKYCDHVEGVTVIPAGHELIDVEGKAPTCTEEGYSAHKACKNCDYIEGKTAIPAAHNYVDGVCGTCKGVVTYFVNVGKWANVYAHMWNASGDITSWPGVKMTKTGETVNGYDVYKIESAKVPANIIFNNNSGAQTADLAFVGGKYFSMLNATWYDNYEDVPKFTTTAYYLPGSFNSWNQTGNQFVKEGTSTVIRSYIALAANKTYEFKVKNGSSWYGYSGTYTATTASPFTLSASNNSNIKVTTKCAGIYVFEFDTTTKKLTVIYPHTVVVLEGKDATCTEDGLTEGKKCSVCNTVIVKQEKIPASHNIVDGVCTVCGETFVGTLEELVAALANGGKITLTADITASDILVIGKPTVLNGNGHTITSSAARAINISGADGVTIKNLTVVASGERAFNVIQNATNVVIENVTATAANYTVNAATSAPNAVVTVKNSTLTGLNVVNIAAPNAVVTVTDSKITCDDQTEVESYAALVLNKDAEGASIVATNVELVINGDSTKANNSTVNGTITIDGSDEEVKSLVAYIPYGDYYYGFETLADAIKAAKTGDTIHILAGTHITNVKIPGGSNITIVGEGESTVLEGQIATTSSTEGTLTLRNLVVNVNDKIVDSTGISQTGKSAIAIWGTQTVVCENVTFNMSLSDSTAITSWWDTGVGTSIVVRNCVFNANGQRPIRATGNVTVENTTFNDPYRYAVQLTAKASTATLLDKATINFKNNTIVNGASGKSFVYGIQFEGKDYGCNNLVVNGEGNTIVAGEWDTENASAMYFCECCPKVDHDTIEWNVEVDVAHEGHTPGAEATCTSAQVCTVCGEVLVEAKGHVWSDVEAKAPTCTVAGYTAHKGCEECGATEGKETVDKIAHADNNGDYKCDVCSTKMLPADGEFLTIPQALAIAKLAGTSYTTQKYFITGIVTNVYNTTYGNLYLKDEAGNELCIYGLYTWDKAVRYDNMEHKPIEGDELTVYTVLGMYSTTCQGKDAWIDDFVAHEHKYTTKVTDPTCTKEGLTTYTCSICGEVKTEKADALGHTTDNGTCERCGETITGDTPTLTEKTYSYTFTKSTYSSANTVSLGDVKWTLSGTIGYFGFDSQNGRGQQFGSKNSPCTTMTLTSESFSNVSKVTINTSGYSKGTVKVYVGDTLVGTITYNNSAKDYSVDVAGLTGEVRFECNNSGGRAYYIKSIAVEYAE